MKTNAIKHVLSNAAKMLGTLLVATLICEVFYQLGVEQQNISIVMVLAVFLIAATTDGYWYGLAASVMAVLAYDYLVTDPRMGFSITLGFPITLSIMLLVALVTSFVTARIKKQARTAVKKERHAELMYEINRKLLSSRDEGEIARCALEYLGGGLHRSVALFTLRQGAEEAPGFYFQQAQGDAGAEYFQADAEQAAMRAAAEGVRRPGGAEGFYYPVVAQGRAYGVFGLSGGEGPPTEDKAALVDLLVGQTAHALRVQALARQQQETMVLADTEKTRSNFLRGISHDLRTPLTSIIGASATLLEDFDGLPPATRVQLAGGIQADAQWLLSMVENILSVTRIQQSDMAIAKTEEAAEEVVGEAVALFRRRHPDALITVHPARDLLLVPMDALLITQVMNNLLDNTRRHGGGQTKVSVEMRERGGYAVVSVTDDGPGIRPQLLPHLFEALPVKPGGQDATRGAGIGLSICKTIVEAHGGWIKAENVRNGGARLTFALPMESEG